MAVEQGMNRPVVIEVSGQLQQDYQQLQDILQNSNQAVQTLGDNWFGSDAQQYVSDWGNQSKTIQAAGDMIQQMAKVSNDQAQQQADTSQA